MPSRLLPGPVPRNDRGTTSLLGLVKSDRIGCGGAAKAQVRNWERALFYLDTYTSERGTMLVSIAWQVWTCISPRRHGQIARVSSGRSSPHASFYLQAQMGVCLTLVGVQFRRVDSDSLERLIS